MSGNQGWSPLSGWEIGSWLESPHEGETVFYFAFSDRSLIVHDASESRTWYSGPQGEKSL